MYGLFWTTVCTTNQVGESTLFHDDEVLYAPINRVYAVFSVVMVYLTAYRNATLSLLYAIIAATFVVTSLERLDMISETLPGIGHVMVGLLAFYYAVASLTQAFTGEPLLPLGPPLLARPVGIRVNEASAG